MDAQRAVFKAVVAAVVLLLAGTVTRVRCAPEPAAYVPALSRKGASCTTSTDTASTTYEVTFYSSAPGKNGAGVYTFAILQTPDMDECAEAATPLGTLADPCCGLTSDASSLKLTLDSACADKSLQMARAWVRTGENGSRRAVELDASWRDGSAVVTLYNLNGVGVLTQLVELQLPASNPCASRVNASTTAAPGPWPCSVDGCTFELLLRANKLVFLDALLDYTAGFSVEGRKRAVRSFNSDGCCRVGGVAELDLSNWNAEDVSLSLQSAMNDAPVRFLVIGDWGANHTGLQGLNSARGQRAVAQAMNKVASTRKPQFVINTGDNAYECGLSGNFPTAAEYFKSNWRDMYDGASIKNLHWYSVAGNHDHFRASSKIFFATRWRQNQKLFPEGCRKRNIEFDSPECRGSQCCYSQAWQWSEFLPSEPRWHMQGGSWQARPEDDNPAVARGLVEFFFLDTNVYIQSYFESSSYDQNLPEGLNVWRAKRDETEAALLGAIRASNATWKIVVGHHTFKNYGTHCTGKEANDTGIRDCADMQPLRKKLEALKIPLYINGHDHSVQLVKLDSGMWDLTSGAGAKRNAIFPYDRPLPDTPPADLLYPTDSEVWGKWGDWVARFKAPFGFNVIAAYPDRLVIEFYEVWKAKFVPPLNPFIPLATTRLAATFTLRK